MSLPLFNQINFKRFYIGMFFIVVFIVTSFVFAPYQVQIIFIILLIGVCILPLVITKPEWVILGLIIFIPIEDFAEKFLTRGLVYEAVRFGGEAILFLLLSFVLIFKIKHGFRWNRTPLDLSFFLFMIVAIIAGWLNSAPISVWLIGVRPLIRYVSVFYILTQLKVSPSFFETCFKLSLLVAIVVSIIGLMQTVIGFPLTNFLIPGDVVIGDTLARVGLRHSVPPRTYIFSTMGRYDTLGVYLMFFLTLNVVAYSFSKKRNIRRIAITFLILGFTALALTFSRQSWIGFALALTVVLILSRKGDFQRTKIVYGIAVLASLALILLLIPNARYFSAAGIGEASLLDRILEPFSSRYLEVSRFSYGRLFVILEVGPRLLKIAPMFGLGPGQFGSLATRFFNIPFYQLVQVPESAAPYISDVNWVVILGQTGILGVLSYCWMYLALFWGAFLRFRSWPSGLEKGVALGFSGTIVAVLVLGFLGPNFEVRQISFFIWLWGGLIMGLNMNTPPRLEGLIK